MVALYAVAVASVLAAISWRAAHSRFAPATLGGLAATAAAAGGVLVVGLAAMPHGAKAHRTRTAGTISAVSTAPGAFSDSFSGSIAQQNASGGSLLSIVGAGTGGRRVQVRIDLVTTDGQTISDTAFQLKDVGSGSVCTGTVSRLDGNGFHGTCTFSGGSSRTVSGTWQVSDQQVAGKIALTA